MKRRRPGEGAAETKQQITSHARAEIVLIAADGLDRRRVGVARYFIIRHSSWGLLI